MSTVGRAARLALVAVATAALLVYAARITHDFYSYIDRAIFVSVDDSEANIAYAISSEGHYGFPASPVLAGQDRSRWQFNYGPWYFYLAGALSWLFGFSLTLVRSIHLWGVLAMVGLAAWYFTGRDRMAATLLFGLGLLYCFEVSHWPMARPDIMVSVFAIVLVMAAGAGTRRMGAWPWFVAGLAASCGAFTHLIAFSLVPSACVLFAVAVALEFTERADRRDAWRAVLRSAFGFAAGGLLGAAMFYASFGFQFGVQYRFLTAYRELTASPVSLSTALGHHLTYAFGYLSNAARAGVWTTFAAAWLMAAASAFMPPAYRRRICAYLVAPVVVWTGYLASSGYYTNYHQGYSMLHQVLFWWMAAALGWLALSLVRERAPRAGAVLSVVVVLALVGQAARQITWSGDSWKVARAEAWVPFSEYSDRVLRAIPARATAWGSIIFGLEAPNRIQLVQWSDAAGLFRQIAPADRAALVPDFIVWAYPEARDNMVSVFRGQESLLFRTAQLLDQTDMRVVSLVAGAPYGVTRTYARRVGPPDASRPLPAVSAYDPLRRRWLTRAGQPVEVAFLPIAPVPLQIGYDASPETRVPAATAAADLPADHYLLRVDVTPGSGAGNRRLLAATSASMVRQTMSELGPDGDFVSYLDRDSHAYLLLAHTGGPLYISQFDGGAGAAMTGITAFPLIGLLDPAEEPRRTRDLPALASWTAVPGVQARADNGTLHVTGDTTAGGYQVVSQLIAAHENNRVTVRVPHQVARGRVCPGALNGTSATWLIAPDTVRDQITFTIDATRGFYVVLANCAATAGEASQFVVADATYLEDPMGTSYAELLVAATLNREANKLTERAGPHVRTVPPGLIVTRVEAEGPVDPVTAGELAYRSPLLTGTGGGWTIAGTADAAFSYVLQSRPRTLGQNDRLLISGRVSHGGASFGLLTDNQWAAQISVADPGEFTLVIAPPAAGTYTVVAAHNLPRGLETSIELSRFGWLPQR